MTHHPRPFDFVVPALPLQPAAPDLDVVPLGLLLCRWRRDLDWEFSLIRGYKLIAGCRSWILRRHRRLPMQT